MDIMVLSLFEWPGMLLAPTEQAMAAVVVAPAIKDLRL